MSFYNLKRPQHLERKDFNKDEYTKLKWDEFDNFDVICSFWTIFAKTVTYEMKNKFTPYKGTYPSMYYSYDRGKRCHDKIAKICKGYKSLPTLSHYCHTVSNFMPCPKNFNSAKGLLDDVKDFLPLMIDKIQNCINNKTNLQYIDNEGPIIIELEQVKKWHEFFLNNQKELCLDMYYVVETDEKVLRGIPFFEGQSLGNPLPDNKPKIEECLNNIVGCIELRADKLKDKLKDNSIENN